MLALRHFAVLGWQNVLFRTIWKNGNMTIMKRGTIFVVESVPENLRFFKYTRLRKVLRNSRFIHYFINHLKKIISYYYCFQDQ